MIYSVWSHANRRYDYFQTPTRTEDTNAPKPSHLGHDTLGLAPEEAAWPLPSGAKFIGSGKYPKGMIASKSSGGLGLGLIPDFTLDNLVLYGALGFFAWHYWKNNHGG